MTDRKIIQIACAETQSNEDIGGTLYALADDGSVWFMTDPWVRDTQRKWISLPRLPNKPD